MNIDEIKVLFNSGEYCINFQYLIFIFYFDFDKDVGEVVVFVCGDVLVS